MAPPESAIYSMVIAAFLLIVYIVPLSYLEKCAKAMLLLPTRCSDIASQKHALMATEILGLTTPESTTTLKLPRRRWTDEKQFQLERRAVFSKTWLFVTHTSKFLKPGDYQTFDISDFSVLLILGKDKQIRAFHNVCRHRAYAVTKKEAGSTTVLGCRYHGWSYDTKGKLIKAPEFDKVPDFDKSANGLWELKIVVTKGMIFVNFDTQEVTKTTPLHFMPSNWKFASMKAVAEWKVEGAFNWKIPVAIPNKVKKQTLWPSLLPAIFHPHQQEIMISPNAIIRRQKMGNVITLRFLPRSAKSTTVDCCIYTLGKMNDQDIEHTKAGIQLEIEQLEFRQRRISHGDFPLSNDSLDRLDDLLKSHRDAELASGGEINPAARSQSTTKIGRDDSEFCRELETEPSFCSANSKGLLDW